MLYNKFTLIFFYDNNFNLLNLYNFNQFKSKLRYSNLFSF